jgi:predicted membrane protein
MDSIVAAATILAIGNLFTSTNFFVILIAVIVAFFLIGLILGYVINPRKRKAKDKKKTKKDGDQEIPQQTDTLGQDDQTYEELQNIDINPRRNDYRNRYHDNYW